MRPVNVVRQLVEHRVDDLLAGEELAPVAGMPEAKQDLLAAVDVETWALCQYSILY